MAHTITVTSLSHEGLDAYTRLTDAQLRSRAEPEKGIFIAESPKVIRLALEAGYTPISLLTEKRHAEGNGREVIEMCGDIPVYIAERELLAELTGYELTRGVLCAMKRPAPQSPDKICENARRIAVLENITDSTNIGAIFRSAAALGIDGVLLTPSCCDPLCRRGIRVSMGTVLLIPWARIDCSADEWRKKGVDILHELGFAAAAMALSGNSVDVDDPRLKSEPRLAVIMGTEGDGLFSETVAASDYTVKIPMCRGVDSLNVAAAAAIAFWSLCKRD